MNFILHLDTSGNKCYVAISKNGKLLTERISDNERVHAASINSLIEKALKEASLLLQNLNAIAVIGGPGSYTGLRIGLATAKGICYALNIPLIMHNKLDLLILHQIENSNKNYSRFAAILPARENEYFVAVTDKSLKPILAPQHIIAADWNAWVSDNMCIVGDGVQEVDIDYPIWHSKAALDFKNNNVADLVLATPFYLKEVHTTTKK